MKQIALRGSVKQSDGSTGMVFRDLMEFLSSDNHATPLIFVGANVFALMHEPMFVIATQSHVDVGHCQRPSE